VAAGGALMGYDPEAEAEAAEPDPAAMLGLGIIETT